MTDKRFLPAADLPLFQLLHIFYATTTFIISAHGDRENIERRKHEQTKLERKHAGSRSSGIICGRGGRTGAVSYTHLTLPTNSRV